MCFNSPFLLESNYSGTNLNYSWYLNDDLISTNVSSISVLEEGIYSLIINDNGGCQFADTISISGIDCEIIIPNVITPNSDSYNDYFEIINIDKYPNSSIAIFNRWGKKVYENSNYQNNWNGENCSEGTYYYILKLNNGNTYTGTITVLY